MISNDNILSPALNKKLHLTLRIAIAMCFIGHGAFGIITKPVWCNYFAVFGIGHDLSYQFMPVVGCIDLMMGMLMLVFPMRAIAAWLIIWGAFTAMLRPLSGEPFAELIERAGNFGAPLALLFLSGFQKNLRGWFTRIVPVKESGRTLVPPVTCLRIIAFLIILGHGWLNLIGKKSLVDQYSAFGSPNPLQLAQIIGFVEIVAAFIVLIHPFRSLLFLLFLWKMTSELLYPHYQIIEWVERGGSYGVLFALWLAAEKTTVRWPNVKWASRKFQPEEIGRKNFYSKEHTN